ncbi:MAG: DUF1801 domain-containing protein [Solobacterium sp.]|nr:DUF1801 domain-containing protein [Solobacterium sp.]
MTIQDYINEQEEMKIPRLQAIYDTIRTTIPEAEERISWGMPTFWKGRNIIHFATAKKHIGLYPGNEAVEEFGEKLKQYKTSKGAIQLPDNRELPLSLIAEISRWCYENNKK